MGSRNQFGGSNFDRRQCRRGTGRIPNLQLWVGDTFCQDAEVLDESLEGISLLVMDATVVQHGQEIRLTHGERSVPAIVRHVHQREDGKYQLGLEWGPCEVKPASQVPSAHSLETLPRARIVVASSVNAKGNRLVLFDVARSNQPIWDTPLPSAHGVVWDEGRQILWALGLKELRCYELKDWESEKPSLAMNAN